MLKEKEFYKLLDAVLIEVGRKPFSKKGSERRIVGVQPNDRVLQILAGPGSGKTEMLVWRVLYELFVLGSPSHKVMVTTFTRRAATELQVRVVERSDSLQRAGEILGLTVPDPRVHDLRIGTIHSLCDSLLAEFDDHYVEAGSQVIDETEVKVRIARNHRWALGYNNPSASPRVLNRLLSKRELVTLFSPPWEENPNWPYSLMDRTSCTLDILNQQTETWFPRCADSGGFNGVEVVHGLTNLTADLVKLQERWEEYLSKNNIFDFATIQKRFLESQVSIAPNLSHIFVDEFQDNNPIQFAIHTGWLQHPGVRLTVVGDDDQAIYRFRGSDIECFSELKPFCARSKIQYRVEKLETNHRSTRRIVDFSQKYHSQSVLASLSMPKNIVARKKAPKGSRVRLLEGPWTDLCNCVASELGTLGAGRIPIVGEPSPPSVAILMFSTSEHSKTSPALELRSAIESKGVRTYNPRNKLAASPGSPVAQLLGLISYLIDPISLEPVGRGGRQVMVAASMHEANKKIMAKSQPAGFPINAVHLEFQKRFFKSDGGKIGSPSIDRAPAVDLVDQIRTEIAKACISGRRPRLTLAGFVARLMSLPYYRNSGFTPTLFRQALFTELLEANIAPTRLTTQSLDEALVVKKVADKYVWDDRYWGLLNVFGSYLDSAPLDDPEVESFEDDAVLMLTFHQGKGLEFDHVYVAGTGRAPDLGPALRTRLFSGKTPRYSVVGGLRSSNKLVSKLASADRDREVYVAITRARKSLTILHDPKHDRSYMVLNPAIRALFKNVMGKPHSTLDSISIKEYSTNG